MAHYIDKDALVAEIEELKTAIDIKLRSSNDSAYWKAQSLICERLKFKVNSLEVKEVDNVWHDASEGPEDKKEIVFHHTEGFYSIGIYSKEKKMINEGIVAWTYDDIDKWCYLSDIIENELLSKQEEPVGENLERAAKEYAKAKHQNEALIDIVSMDFKAGAKWQHEQLERNRIAACERATKEEIEREQDFCDKIIIGEHRQPTYSDAIEYGIKWQKEQMMKDAVSAYVRRNKYTKKNVLNGFDVICEPIQKFKDRDNVKVIIVKDD